MRWLWKKISCQFLFPFPLLLQKKIPLLSGVIFKKTIEELLKP